ncbi:COG3014 family protein [Aliivibrio sifiae]|uniref:Uncharacterized protein n=1 Tax=Aliivibrio sifiae TaxID=566293 RepID=A0A2S7XJT8_9GAMM|nr:hypothetical protein [Aliivibrio sifiae]PQJ93652.1 hypothetical protein BTO23_06060 [Aliivibrio sifiae]
MTSILKKSIVLSFTLLLSGCANLSVGNLFSHYSVQTDDTYQLVKNGDAKQAYSEEAPEVGGPILDNLERGRVALLSEQYAESKADFEGAEQAARIQSDQAVISVSDSANQVGSLVTNDNLIDYKPADYELGYLHLYLSLNYLKNNDLEGALIEVRKANYIQEQAKRDREKELRSAEKDAKKQGFDANVGAILANYPDVGNKLAAVQNGYLFYYSGLLFETNRNYSDAYIDYKRALAVAPNNKTVIESVQRLARRLGMRNDITLLEKQYGAYKVPKRTDSRVIIIDEQGILPQLSDWRLRLPMWDSQGNFVQYNLALPYYKKTNRDVFSPLKVNNKALASDQLADVTLMARNDLNERIPAMVIRQALRVVAKDELRKTSRNTKEEDLANAVLTIFNSLTEQPDTRSWQTLPSLISVTSVDVKAGDNQIQYLGNELNFTIKEGHTVVVWVSRQGNAVTWWHKQLGEI